MLTQCSKAHFNLRDQYLPYRYLIAEILRDKVPNVRTVINKVDDVGSSSEFRTFDYELIAGDDDMNVVVHEQDCEFSFDYSKVYWNSRLSTEHGRMVDRFKEGEAVCDVMAGVGPFALPAGKKRVFVWANDLNPHGYERMVHGVKKNKIQDFVKPFNMNGRDFIRYATESLHTNEPAVAKIRAKQSRNDPPPSPASSSQKQQKQTTSTTPSKRKASPPPAKILTSPNTFDHYVMNLPATAIEFLDSFIGVYAGQETLFQPHTSRLLPLVHVYCFSTNSDDQQIERDAICRRISEKIGYKLTTEDCEGGSGDKEREVEVRSVRLVSPNKRMFCASFRLPGDVVFKKDF